MTKIPLPTGVHLILGGSAGGIFNRNFGSRQRMVDDDRLSCGPTPRCPDWTTWRELRLDWWQSIWAPPLDTWRPNPFGLYDSVERLREAEVIHIWAATGLDEQLFVAFVVQLTTQLGIELARLKLLQFERTKTNGEVIRSMGHLNEENMAACPTPTEFSPETRDDYLAAWQALTSPDPAAIEQFAAERPRANPWLKATIPLLLRQYPQKTSGLPHWDHVMLRAVRDRGPKISRVIGEAIVAMFDDGDLIGEEALIFRLRRMAGRGSPNPLVRIAEDERGTFWGRIELTPHGLAVLDGRVSNIELNPIDDWAAGVKLSSADDTLWFNDGGRLVRG
jgi:hypothetical protein